MPHHTFISDRYRKSRGGYSRFLAIACASCNARVAIYQKDGPGPLKRMYFDRIVAPDALARSLRVPLDRVKPLMCPQCRSILGTPYMYPKERRPAFRLYQDAVKKRVVVVDFEWED